MIYDRGVRARILALIVLAACGGPRAGGGGVPPSSAPSAPDPVKMRAVLAQHSPRGAAIIDAYEALPEEFELAEGPYKVTSEDTFDGYMREGAIERWATQLATVVHEMTHGYIGTMSFQLLAERGLPWGQGAEAILVDGEPWLVPFTDTFPAREMAESFPADARSYLYDAYVVTPDEPNLATQKLGVYGLIDELDAFYQGFRTALDLWPWVQEQRHARVAMEYGVLLDDAFVPYAQFKLFILHWLLHARDHHAEIYDAVIANDAFRGAFTELDTAFAALVAEIAALEPTVHAFARELGVDIARVDGTLTLGGVPQRPEKTPPYEASLVHLDEEAYREILAAVTGGGT